MTHQTRPFIRSLSQSHHRHRHANAAQTCVSKRRRCHCVPTPIGSKTREGWAMCLSLSSIPTHINIMKNHHHHPSPDPFALSRPSHHNKKATDIPPPQPQMCMDLLSHKSVIQRHPRTLICSASQRLAFRLFMKPLKTMTVNDNAPACHPPIPSAVRLFTKMFVSSYPYVQSAKPKQFNTKIVI